MPEETTCDNEPVSVHKGIVFLPYMVNDLSPIHSGLMVSIEGKGVVSQGKLNEEGLFVASEVLAKHDENYMPPEAQHAMDQAAAAKAAKSVQTPAPVKGNP
jgi:predicted alternative tryptophan synthase beta-subunit